MRDTTSSLHILDLVLQSTVEVQCGVFSLADVVCVAHMPCFSPLAFVGSEPRTQFLLHTRAGNNT